MEQCQRPFSKTVLFSAVLQAHSLPGLELVNRNAVPAAVTCMTSLSGNLGTSILPARDVLIGSQDGQVTRFYMQADKGHAIKALPQFIRNLSAQGYMDAEPITALCPASQRNEFAMVVGDQLVLIFDCIQWKEKTRFLVDFR